MIQTQTNSNAAITATRVPHDEYAANLARALPGIVLSLEVEAYTFSWARKLADTYNGGLWDICTISNGGFFFIPDLGAARVQMNCIGMQDTREVSAEAVGITATLFSLAHVNSMRMNTMPESESLRLQNHYEALYAYATSHADASAIAAALD